jgi:hypothetical protein
VLCRALTPSDGCASFVEVSPDGRRGNFGGSATVGITNTEGAVPEGGRPFLLHQLDNERILKTAGHKGSNLL